MGNCRRGPASFFLLWFLMTGFELCTSLNHEGIALLRFRELVEADPCGALLDWDKGYAGPCSWFGVQCSDDGRVIGFVLHRNLFYGIIPREIRDLQELKVLDVGYNNFNGSIPSELINILSLEFTFLKGNRLVIYLLN